MTGRRGEIFRLIERGGMLEAPGPPGDVHPVEVNKSRHILMAGIEG